MSLEGGSARLPKIYTGDLSPTLPPRDLGMFARVTVYSGKGNNQSFQRFPDTGSELIQNVTRVHESG